MSRIPDGFADGRPTNRRLRWTTVVVSVAALVVGLNPVAVQAAAPAGDQPSPASRSSVADAVQTQTPAVDRVVAAQPLLYYIKPAHAPKRCLTVHKASKKRNAPIRLYKCLGRKNQQFYKLPGRLTFSQYMNRNSEMCITVHKASKSNGAVVNQYDCNNATNQNIHGFPGKAFRFAHSRKCLNVKGASKANNAKLIQWTCVNKKNGKFLLTRV